MTTRALLDEHAAAWQAATQHPFLEGVRDGTLAREAFDRWLVQDYLFVADLLRFQARLLARAPRSAQAVLAGGLVALEAELGWFEQHAAQRRLDLDLLVPRLPATAAYLTALQRLDDAPVAVALTALWAIECAYLDAWRGTLPGGAEYADFVTHWTTPEFRVYVEGLAAAADRALAADGHDAAESAFLEIAELERDFWQMAFQ